MYYTCFITMSRSFKKIKNHQRKGTGFFGNSIYEDNRYFELRRPRTRRCVLRQLKNEDSISVRPASIPPSTYEDKFATGRVGGINK